MRSGSATLRDDTMSDKEPEPERMIPDDWFSNDDMREGRVMAAFVQWCRANAIRLDVYTEAEVMEFILRYQKAAG